MIVFSKNVLKTCYDVVFILLISWIFFTKSSEEEIKRALDNALKTNDVYHVKKLIEAKVNVNVPNEDGDAPLHLAAAKGCSDIVKILLAASAKVNMANKVGAIPLHVASRYNVSEIVSILIDHKANLNAFDRYGDTPFYEAIKNGCVDVLTVFLAAGVSVNGAHNKSFGPLGIACLYNRSKMVSILIDHKASINVVDNDGDTLLHAFAVGEPYDTVFSILLNARANVNIANNRGITPLHNASMYNVVKSVYALINHQADIDAVDNDGDTPLKKAAKEGFGDVVKVLLAASADPNR